MDLKKINSCLAYYFQWSNSKSDPVIFAEFEKQLEKVTRDFFSELTGNEKFFSWMHLHYFFKNQKDYMSILAEVGSSMVKSAEKGSSLFSLSDLRDIHGLISKLMNNHTILGKYVTAKISADIEKWSNKNEFQEANTKHIEEKIVDSLNSILKDKSFYNEEVFQEVEIKEEIRIQFAKNPKGINLIRLNRSLLETLYPLHIKWYPKPICFDTLNQFENWIFKSMKGKANMRMKQGQSATDILADRIKTAKEQKKTKEIKGEDAVKEFDNRIDKAINDENEMLEEVDGGSEESISDYDEDGNEITGRFTSIENIGDPSEADRQELNTLRTDLSLFNDTVAFLLWLIHQDLSEEDIVLEKKIAWQIGGNYDVLLREKVGLFTDPILVAHDFATVIRYEHWQSYK